MEDKDLQQRLNLVYRIMQLAAYSPVVEQNSKPKLDFFYVARTILFGSEPYGCCTRQRLISLLKKSDLWPDVKPYLKNK